MTPTRYAAALLVQRSIDRLASDHGAHRSQRGLTALAYLWYAVA